MFDGELEDSEQFAVTVTQVNDSPLIASIAPSEVYLGDAYTYSVNVDDPDDTEFTFELDNALPGMTISDDGLITWIPESVGDYGPVTVSVFDGGEDGSLPGTELFTISVVYNYTVIDFTLSQGNNLVSFYSIPPEDQSVEFVFDNLGSNITHIIGESELAFHLDNGNWVGSLSEITPEKGYWVRMDDENVSYDLPVFGLPVENVEYIVHLGANLLSYSHGVSQNIDDAIPEEYHQYIDAIYSQNTATINVNGQWLGSLNSFEPGDGYWLIANEPFVFEYNNPQGASLARENVLPPVPEEFSYHQSIYQSFYFAKDVALNNNNIEIGDWVVAYNGETIVGSRMWNGEYTDIPVMGYDETDENTQGYCQSGDSPRFVLYKQTGEVIDLVSESSLNWDPNSIVVIELEDVVIPQEIVLNNAYPNPFNPSTTISYQIPEGGANITLSIYDLRGRLVAELANGFHEYSEKSYEINWNANNFASGIYLITLSSDEKVKTQKITLIK